MQSGNLVLGVGLNLWISNLFILVLDWNRGDARAWQSRVKL